MLCHSFIDVRSSTDSAASTAETGTFPRPGAAKMSQVVKEPGLVSETQAELEWCLEQLESMSSSRSVSDLASNKVSPPSTK